MSYHLSVVPTFLPHNIAMNQHNVDNRLEKLMMNVLTMVKLLVETEQKHVCND